MTKSFSVIEGKFGELNILSGSLDTKLVQYFEVPKKNHIQSSFDIPNFVPSNLFYFQSKRIVNKELIPED